MIEDVFKAAIELLDKQEKAALSTIISSKGSLPMSEKSKMLVTPEGKIIGTVGGGCLEADKLSVPDSCFVPGGLHITPICPSRRNSIE